MMHMLSLKKNGEQGNKLNFPDDFTEVYEEVTGNDFVVTKSSPKFVILFVWESKEKKTTKGLKLIMSSKQLSERINKIGVKEAIEK